MDQYKFVSGMIRSYYKSKGKLEVNRINEREFGFGTFDKKIAHRHMKVEDSNQLNEMLVKEAPPYVSCSAAYYKYPDARPMERKVWEGSELIFDLDATDMHLKCTPEHARDWVCGNCFDKVREEAVKLVDDFLMPDFGFSDKEISINFSGNRGYHVRIERDDVLMLSSDARKEMSDYISGNNIDFVSMFPTSQKRGVLRGPKMEDPGWGGKIARNFVDTLNRGPDALAEELGVEKSIAKKLYKNRTLISMGIGNGNWDMVYIKNKAEFWKDMIGRQAISQSDKIDKNVTTDPSHLIRLQNTLHGSTGLVARKIKDVSELADFDPMLKCVAFKKGELKMKVGKVPKFEILGEQVGPFDDEQATLPVYAGLYIFLKGLGQIISYNE